MDKKQLECIIEALLFYKVEPLSKQEIMESLSIEGKDLEEVLEALNQSLSERGIRLVRRGEEVALMTAPEASTTIDAFRREELSKDLGKAALETLAIVLYRGPVTRSDVDYVRGVNSTFTLRNLLMRGLIERIPNPQNQRGYLYQPTIGLLGHLGVTHVEELPEFATVQQELESFERELNEEDNE